MKVKLKKKTDKIEVVADTLSLDWEGIHDCRSFTEMLENAFKQANEQHNKTLIRYDFFFEREWDYDSEYHFRFKMRVYRLENDQELEHRQMWEKRRKEEDKKQEQKEREANEKKKKIQELRAKDPEYQKYQELQKSLRKRKVI